MSDGMYNVGGIEASLGGVFDERAFQQFEREVDKAQAKAKRDRIEAQLGAQVDERAFQAYEKHLDKIEHRTKRRDAFKAALGATYDPQALRAYERELDKIEREQQKLMRSNADLERSNQGAARSFLGSGNAVSGLNRNVQALRNSVQLLKWPAAITGVGLFAQAVSAAAGGVGALAAGLGPLGGLLAAIPAAGSAAAQGVGAVKLATLGVSDAISTAFEGEATASGAVTDALGKQEAAAESIRSAELRLTDAKRQAAYAQDDLTKARRDARMELLDLRDAVEGNRISEERARLELRAARDELTRVWTDPKASAADVEEAELALRQARFDMGLATKEAERSERDYEKARDGGVKKMPQVLAADRALREAKDERTEAARALGRAERDAGRDAAEAAADVSKLEEQLAKLPPAARAFAKDIIALKPRLDELRADTAQEFFPGVRRGLRDALGLLDVFERRLPKTGNVLGDIVGDAGAYLGRGDVLADVETQMRRNDRWLRQAGEGGLDLADALRHVVIEAGPLVDWLVKGTRELAGLVQQEAEAGRESGELAKAFDETKDTLDDVFHIAGDLAGALWEIGKAGKPLGDEILGDLRDGAQEFRDWTESAAGANELQQYFDDARPAVKELGRLTEDLVRMFFRLGRGDQVAPLLEQIRTDLLPVLEEVIDNTTEAFGPALIGTLVEVLELFGRLVDEGGPLVAAVELVGGIADAITDLMDMFPPLEAAVGTVFALGGLAKALQIGAAITGIGRLNSLLRTTKTEAAAVGVVGAGSAAGAGAAGAAGSRAGSAAAGAAGGAAAGRAGLLARGNPYVLGIAAGILAGQTLNDQAGIGDDDGGRNLASGREDNFGLRTSADDFGQVWGSMARGFTDDPAKQLNEFGDRVKGIGDNLQKLPAGRLRALAEEARELTDDSIRLGLDEQTDALQRFAATADDLAEDAQRRGDVKDGFWVGSFTRGLKELRVDGIDSIEDLRKVLDRNMDAIGRGFKQGSEGAADAMASNFGEGIRAVKKAMREGEVSTKDGMDAIEEITRRQMRYAARHMDSFSDEGRDAVATNFRRAATAIETQMKRGVIATEEGLEKLRELVAAELELYGVDEKKARQIAKQTSDPNTAFHIAGHGPAPVPSDRKAGGGWIGMPGEAGGDDVDIRVGRGEAVLNRHQQSVIESYLGDGFLDDLFATVQRPHFMARGGRVPERFAGGGYPMVSGDTDFMPALGRALSAMAKATGHPIYVTDGRRTMAEQAALYASKGPWSPTNPGAAPPNPNAPHIRGIAGDVRPGRETFGSIAARFGLTFPISNEPWHVELLNAVGRAVAGGGALDVVAAQLKKVRVRGDLGAVSKVAQGAVDMAHGAAQARIDAVAGSMAAGPVSPGSGGGAGGGGGGGRLGLQPLVAMAQRYGMPPIMGGVAWNESDGDQYARNPSGASGFWQIMMPLHQALVNRFGGNVFAERTQALTARELYRQSGLGPWEESREKGAHGGWGRLLGQLARGGRVPQRFAGGGRPGAPKPLGRGVAQPTTRSPSGGGSPPAPILSGAGIRSIERGYGIGRNERGLPVFEDQIERLEEQYRRTDKVFDLSVEEFVIEQEDGSAVVDMQAVEQRVGEIDTLRTLREQIAAKLREYKEAVLRMIEQYRKALGWLRGALQAATGGRRQKERQSYQTTIAEYEARIVELDDMIGGQSGIDARTFDNWIESETLGQERAEVASVRGRSAPERDDLDFGSFGGDEGVRDPTPTEIAEQAAVQLRTFQSGVDELFAGFGQNFVRRGADPFGGELARLAGLRSFGAVPDADQAGLGVFGGGGGFVLPNGAQVPAGARVVYQDITMTQPREDPLLFVQSTFNEASAGIGAL